MAERETQNMYPSNPKYLGGSRTKPYVVVTDWWYESILHLINHCTMNARGWGCEKTPDGLKQIPPDTRMMQYLIDNDLLDSTYAYGQSAMPINGKAWWRFKWWFKRLWRFVWMRERYKLDRYWMHQYKNPRGIE